MSSADSRQSDDELMRAAVTDRGAFDALVLRHGRQLQVFCFRYLGNEHEAAELAQETFLRIYQRRASYTPGTSLKTWLFQTARYLCLDMLKRRRRGGRDVPASAYAVESYPARPARNLELSEERAALAEAIARLPVSHYEILNLHVYHDMSFSEIARTVGSPVTTVKSRMQKAIQLLRAELRGFLSDTS